MIKAAKIVQPKIAEHSSKIAAQDELTLDKYLCERLFVALDD